MASTILRSYSLLLFFFLSICLVFSRVEAQSAAPVAEPEQAAAKPPLVPDLELPPPKKQKRSEAIVDNEQQGSLSPSPSAKAKRSEGGRGFVDSRRSAPAGGKRRRNDFDYYLFVR